MMGSALAQARVLLDPGVGPWIIADLSWHF
jgi:hypothetical protein